ncbi:MAG: NADH-quinone oxidoreductase subunit N [Proteobacteria bacterium]|nr:NADH-quinone oxidoreductase subunit N [Pseudomonadota bacterium]MBU1685984.1 NADH-quinone oxidoreductase subunit N [Pseudomonadota bacterium]
MKFMLFAPELWVLFGSLVLFFVALADGNGRTARFWAALIVVGNIALTSATFFLHGDLFQGVYRIDLFSQLFKVLVAFGLGVVVLMNRDLRDVPERIKPEYYLFLLLSGLGLMMVVSCVELLSLFVALELSSFALYLLVPMRDDRNALRIQMEAASKYILYGVMATGVMLFGMSYLFGLTGTTVLAELLPKLHNIGSQPAALVAIMMVLAGFFFKLGLFPFHFWLPDVYQGAANETSAFIASVPKLAAIALLIRIASFLVPEDQSAGLLLGGLAVASMFYGNLLALVQKDLKRLLGFSGIAHAGYVMLGIVVLKDSGFATAIYYIAGYLIMNLACFLVICNVSTDGGNLQIDDLSGLYRRAPLLAIVLGVGMFSLAGIPPFVGFMGKFMLLAGALKQGYLVLVILAAINTAISIFYYLSVVRVAYCTDPERDDVLPVSFMVKALGVVLVAVIIVMGVAPASLVELAQQAVATIR